MWCVGGVALFLVPSTLRSFILAFVSAIRLVTWVLDVDRVSEAFLCEDSPLRQSRSRALYGSRDSTRLNRVGGN